MGAPIDRADGILKVTGEASYAADFNFENLIYGIPILSTCAKGKVVKIDDSDALKIPGVLTILTSQNTPEFFPAKSDFGTASQMGEIRLPLQDETIHYAGQYLGVVLAETLESAEEAEKLVKVLVEEEPPILEMEKNLSQAYSPKAFFGEPLPVIRGNFEKAFSEAEIKLEEIYTTPVEHHNPMEPHASIAVWDGENLTLYESTQWVVGARNVVADALKLPREKVKIISWFVGGGFGCKGFIWPHTLLSSLAAMQMKRPVKVLLSRRHLFTTVGHRPATCQKLTLGASRSGKISALKHHTITHTSFVGEFLEGSGGASQNLYDFPNLQVIYQVVRLNKGTPTFMRAPGESTGLFALESLLDELSYKLKIDPIELRLKNYAERHPETGLPWSSSNLKECLQIGAEKFGWKNRNPDPGSMKQGNLSLGWGMAVSMFPGFRSPGSARVKILPDNTASVESATQDMGTGTYTTMKQIAAEILSLPPEKINSFLGDSSYPAAPISGGSMTSASVGPAVEAAAKKALRNLINTAIKDKASLFYRCSPDDLQAKNGNLIFKTDPSKAETFGEILLRNNLPFLEGEAFIKPDQADKKYAFQSHGAQFAEVLIDPYLKTIRLNRMVGIFDVGAALNLKTARSQAIGGMIMGIGMALYEKTVYDLTTGRVVNDNLSDYLIPVMADIPSIDVEFIDKPDPYFNSLGVRGLGEIGITGTAAAIANAVYHATGIRIRDLPITLLDKNQSGKSHR
ncbi:MAG: xanthine dehydrogenase family protein molybdopterin-binding subunit [Candidatus Eremiobacteraeota bacterium]|nr:xanthine dehydrogenase family protein molybdopterin-binding subunit [Candidatus Eremiobacteraeota bacterium]